MAERKEGKQKKNEKTVMYTHTKDPSNSVLREALRWTRTSLVTAHERETKKSLPDQEEKQEALEQ